MAKINHKKLGYALAGLQVVVVLLSWKNWSLPMEHLGEEGFAGVLYAMSVGASIVFVSLPILGGLALYKDKKIGFFLLALFPLFALFFGITVIPGVELFYGRDEMVRVMGESVINSLLSMLGFWFLVSSHTGITSKTPDRTESQTIKE